MNEESKPTKSKLDYLQVLIVLIAVIVIVTLQLGIVDHVNKLGVRVDEIVSEYHMAVNENNSVLSANINAELRALREEISKVAPLD